MTNVQTRTRSSFATRIARTGTAVIARDVSVVRRGSPVLQRVDLDIERGSITGVLGPSGCGKTTLLRAILGLQSGVRGSLAVLGERPGHARLRRRVASVSQAPSVYDDLSVQANLAYFARVVGAPASAVERVLDAVDLQPVRRRAVGELSGGQRNRVSLAVALLGEPELLVLDEPTVGLDPILRRNLWAMFRRVADSGTTIVVTSHVMDEAAHCDRIVLLRAGTVLADSTRDGLLYATDTTCVEDAFLRLVAN